MKKIHGMYRSSIYNIWKNMLQRCNNPNNPYYKYYGARGITVCKRWLKFENFYKDMGEKPKGLTIERKDNDGNYESSNCEWATIKQNSNNRRSNIIIEYKSERLNIKQWARKLNINYNKLWQRLQRYHWPIEKAFNL